MSMTTLLALVDPSILLPTVLPLDVRTVSLDRSRVLPELERTLVDAITGFPLEVRACMFSSLPRTEDK